MVELSADRWRRFTPFADGRLPALFLLLGIPLGLIFALGMPPFQIPDEVYHFFRSYSVSTGACVPPTDRAVPASLIHLEDKLAEINWALHPAEYRRFLQLKWSEGDSRQPISIEPNLYNCLYTCFPYLASAAGIELGKAVSQSALILMYCGRFANLALYLLLTYIALRITPVCRTAMFGLALMPMTLHQAASVSADAATIASAFLYCAYVFYLAFDPRITILTLKNVLILGALMVFASLCKLNLPFVLLPLLIPAVRFGTNTRRVLAVVAVFLVVAVVMGVWQWADHANVATFQAARANRGIDSAKNLSFVVSHPIEFADAFLRTVRSNVTEFATEFVGRLGLLTIPLTPGLVWSYLAVLLVAALDASQRAPVTPFQRVICCIVLLGSVFSVFLLIWMLETPQSFLAEQILGSHQGWIMGVQGRYFIPFGPILFLLLSNTRLKVRSSVAIAITTAMIVIAACVTMGTVYGYYYLAPSTAVSPSVIAKAGAKVSKVGIYRKGLWLWAQPGSKTGTFGGLPGDIPVVGDWNGDGTEKLGIYRSGTWILDWDGDGQFTSKDRTYNFGGLPGDIPVTGDWTGDGRTKSGIYRNGVWLLDTNGNGKFDEGLDQVLHFGGMTLDLPIVGDWVGDRRDRLGIFRQGYFWILDYNGNGIIDAGDKTFPFGGIPGDLPVVGDWIGSGSSQVGIFRQGYFWILDANGNHRIDSSGPGQDIIFSFGGLSGDKPVVRKW